MTSTATAPPRPDVESGLDAFETAVDALVEAAESPLAGGAQALSGDELVRVLRRLELARSRLQAADTALITAVERTGVPDRLLTRTVPGTLASVLRISRHEASARVRLAQATAATPTASGAAREPQRPVLAEAVRRGRVNPRQAQVILGAAADLGGLPQVGKTEQAWAERELTDLSRLMGPEDLGKVATKIRDVLDPDGSIPDETQRARRELNLTSRGDGYHLSGTLTKACGAMLSACLEPLAAPRPDDAGGHDERTPAQRRHDALEMIAGFITSRLPRSAGSGSSTADPGNSCQEETAAGEPSRADEPAPGRESGSAGEQAQDEVVPAAPSPSAAAPVGGPTATMVVTIDFRNLVDGIGHGHTTDGALIPTSEVIRLAGQAEIIPTFLADSGAVLALGRTRRFASRAQTLALIARDGGCSFPGCGLPAEWCDRHHLIAWADGGPTDLDNLTLVCQYHHYRVFEQGWICRLNADRLVEWVPPRHIDPTRTPVVCRPLRGPT